jgi:ATP synthase proteolipid subunit
VGAAYGAAKSACGILFMGVMRPELVMRNVIPVDAAAGVLGIYGLIVMRHHPEAGISVHNLTNYITLCVVRSQWITSIFVH